MRGTFLCGSAAFIPILLLWLGVCSCDGSYSFSENLSFEITSISLHVASLTSSPLLPLNNRSLSSAVISPTILDLIEASISSIHKADPYKQYAIPRIEPCRIWGIGERTDSISVVSSERIAAFPFSLSESFSAILHNDCAAKSRTSLSQCSSCFISCSSNSVLYSSKLFFLKVNY